VKRPHHGIDYNRLFRTAMYPWGDDWRGHHDWFADQEAAAPDGEPTTIDELDAQLERLKEAS
jgi:hypothetical protein